MKKLLTILTLLVAAVSQGFAEEKQVWEGSEAISWNTEVAPGTQFETPDGTFTGLKKDDIIRVYTTTTYDNPQYVLTYKKGDSWEWTDLDTSVSEGVISYTVADETIATEIAERGLVIRGQAYTITKITVETPSSGDPEPQTYDGTLIYDGDAVVMGTDWSQYIQLAADKFTDLNPGAVIRVYIKDVAESDAQAVFQDGSWQDIEGVDGINLASTDTYYELTLTSSVLAVAKLSGLIVKGKNFTASAVSIMSTGTPITQYTLTTSATNGSIEVSPTSTDGKYDEGTSVTLTATANSGYAFSKWQKDGNDLSDTSNPLALTIDADMSITAVFESTAIPAFSLDGFVADADNSYDATTHALTTASGWSGMQLWIGNYSTYSGNKLVLRTSEDCLLKVTVGYTDDTSTELTEDAAVKVRAITLDNSKKIQKVIVQNQAAGTITFTEMSLDPLYTVNITAEHGSVDVKADGNATTATSFAYGTVLGLNATPDDGYTFTGWNIGPDGTSTDNPLTYTVTSDIAFAAGFTEIPVVTPVFTDGAADLSKFEVQDAEKVTYDATTHKITVTEGWTGVQITATTADDVQGKELRITFAEAAKIKASVKYADDSATDSIMSEAATILYMVIDGTKKISQIQIQPTEAGSITLSEVVVNAESTKPADPEPTVTPVFTEGAADLSKFEVQDAEKVTYDATTHKITVTEGWTGVQITATTADDVQGKELRITFAEAAKIKASVKYADDSATDSIMSEAATILYMVIDGTKKISQIQIQPTEAGSVTLSEVVVNAESTKPADPEPTVTPVFTEGAADLSKFEVQDAEKVTYDATTHKITVTEGWTGVQITATTADDVQGKELRITFAEAAKIKASVKYADDSATDSIMSEAATILYMVIDGTKKISQIQIQPTEAGSVTLSEVIVNAESTKPADPEPVVTPVFTDGKADLSKFEVQDAEKVTYDATTHKITVTEGWTGVQITATTADDVQGKELRITFAEAAKIKASVKYADDSATDSIMSEAATILYMVIDGTKKISQIQIQPTEAGSVTLSEVVVNAESTKPADPVDPRTEKTLVEKSAKIADGDITINRGLFSNAVVGDIIRIYATLSDGAKIALEPADYSGALDGANWVEFSESPFSLKLTASLLETVKAKNLLVRGENYTFTKATLYTEKALGEEIKDDDKKDDEKKDDEKKDDTQDTIFDKEGEADLSEMTAQDSKTTVTYNAKDESITIKTTEDYKAAQIWFNNPETVTGNVLEVDIAESGVSVTVTVQYTDGSQSQMSSTASASARAMTRAAAGTVIKVPVETGKKVQNIEVKNAKAGTITIKKMAMITENVFGSDGKANLSMVKPQSNATYDVTTHTLATTQGWTGATVSPLSSENVSGEELLVRFVSPAQVKVAVKYRTNVDGPSVIMDKPANNVRLTLDKTKQVQEIMIQPTTASILTFSEIAVNGSATKDEVEQIFTNGKADLSKFVPQDENKVIYDAENHIIKATEGWTGVELNLGEGQEVSGKELKISFGSATKVKVAVTYTDGKSTTLIMDDPDEVLRMEIDGSKKIQKIEIQPTEASNVTLKEVAVNKEPEDLSLKEGETRDLWVSGSGVTLNWNETAQQRKSVGSLLQEFDEILITVSGVAADNEWPKVFLRDAQSNQVGKEVLLNEVETFPYIVRIRLNAEMAEQVQRGFSICGDGVTVTKLQVYHPYTPKKGDIHLKALDYGYSSSYDARSYTVTTSARWAARGWEIGDMRYNSKDLVIISFEPVDFPVTIKMEYVDGNGEKQATSTGVAPGNTDVQMAIPEGIKQLDKVYLIFQNPGSLTLTDAVVVTKSEARSRGFINDGISGTTSLHGVNSEAENRDEYYDLQGRRVEMPSKGLYIRNGKKIIVK